MPDGLESIDENAFYECTALERIEIPDTVKGIGDYAFYGCASLKEVKFPKNLVSIDVRAFLDCISLTEITLPEGMISIDELAFNGCVALTSITIPSSVLNIFPGAFASCDNLTRVTVLGATKVREKAFIKCTNLTEIKFMSSEVWIDSDKNTIPESAVIYGAEGSDAQKYAEKHGRQFVVLTCEHVRVKDEAVAATCVDTGLTEGEHCNTCGEVFVAQETIPATGVHAFGEWVITFPANYVDEGEEMRECAHCDATETRAIPVLTPSDAPQDSEHPDDPQGGEYPDQSQGSDAPDDPQENDTPDTTQDEEQPQNGAPTGWIVGGVAAAALVAAGVVITKKKRK